jgi:hypothetical protein
LAFGYWLLAVGSWFYVQSSVFRISIDCIQEHRT